MPREKSGKGDFQRRLVVGGSEKWRAEPNPLQLIQQGRASTEPVKKEVGTGGMSKDAHRRTPGLEKDLFDQAARLRDSGHVSPETVGFSVPRPVKTDHPVSGPGQQSGSPIVATDMITETMHQENRPLVPTRGMPLPKVNILRKRRGLKMAAELDGFAHLFTLGHDRKYSSCG